MKRAPSNASLCVKCGKCETHCPQKIAIRQELQNVARAFEKFYYRPVRFLTSKFMKL
jgi:predicted aldo/keto reductase-like oxidoreductase